MRVLDSKERWTIAVCYILTLIPSVASFLVLEWFLRQPYVVSLGIPIVTHILLTIAMVQGLTKYYSGGEDPALHARENRRTLWVFAATGIGLAVPSLIFIALSLSAAISRQWTPFLTYLFLALLFSTSCLLTVYRIAPSHWKIP